MKYVQLSEDKTTVTNVIQWDGVADIGPTDHLVKVEAGTFVGPGFHHVNGRFEPAPEADTEPEYAPE